MGSTTVLIPKMTLQQKPTWDMLEKAMPHSPFVFPYSNCRKLYRYKRTTIFLMYYTFFSIVIVIIYSFEKLENVSIKKNER